MKKNETTELDYSKVQIEKYLFQIQKIRINLGIAYCSPKNDSVNLGSYKEDNLFEENIEKINHFKEELENINNQNLAVLGGTTVNAATVI